MTNEAPQNTPLVFIVEGHDEVASFPSLACRILGGHLHVPCAKAASNAEIVADLEKLLSQVVIRYHPLSIVVALDLRDMRDHPELKDCSLLRSQLQGRANAWLGGNHSDRHLPLPQNIQIVIQVQTLEAWLLADIEGLKSLGYVRPDVSQEEDADIVVNPYRVIKEARAKREYKKAPKLVKEIVSELNPSVMAQNSRSFNKFSREVQRAYNIWLERQGILGSP